MAAAIVVEKNSAPQSDCPSLPLSINFGLSTFAACAPEFEMLVGTDMNAIAIRLGDHRQRRGNPRRTQGGPIEIDRSDDQRENGDPSEITTMLRREPGAFVTSIGL